jgi:alpha-galactosidase
MRTLVRWLLLIPFVPQLSAAVETVPLAAVVNVRDADYEHSRPVADQSTRNQPLTIAGQVFRMGLGMQADNRTAVELNGAVRFTALAGIDDATESELPIHLEVQVDGLTAWQNEMKKGEPAVAIDLEVRGKKVLVLICRDLGNNYTQAHVDWADARFTVEGDKPKSVLPPALPEAGVILTPKAPAAPRINGARVFGVRPGHPFLYQIPATGGRPMKYAADSLPAGLALDAATGRITGTVAAPGTHRVTLRATNAHGTDAQPLRIEVGERISLTPAMGWNSWNCWGVNVDQEKVLASARAIVARGLADHGWSYINIDDTWQGARPAPTRALQPNAKFPDLKQFCDDLHAMDHQLCRLSRRQRGQPGRRLGQAAGPEKAEPENQALASRRALVRRGRRETVGGVGVRLPEIRLESQRDAGNQGNGRRPPCVRPRHHLQPLEQRAVRPRRRARGARQFVAHDR